MLDIIYRSKIVAVGESASQLFEEGIMVFFAQNAPAEFLEYAVVLEHLEQPVSDIVPNDILAIDSKGLRIVAVGSLVNENFSTLGHLMVKLNAGSVAELDGDVNVVGEKLFIPQSGAIMQILRTAVTAGAPPQPATDPQQ